MKRALDRPLAQITMAISLADAIDDFIIDREMRRLSPRTIKYYRDELGFFRSWLGERATHDVRTSDLRRWFLALGERRNAGGLHANYRALRAFFRWVWQEYEYEQTNPMVKIAPPKVPDKRQDPVSLDTVRTLLQACKSGFYGRRNKAMVLGLLDTGCRSAEFLALNIGDVDVRSGRVRIDGGKGGKDRVVFLGRRALGTMRRYLRLRPDAEPADALWVSIKGWRLSYEGLRSMVRHLAERAGVPAPRLHDFRRAFCIESLRNGANIYALQQMTGHADLDTLRRYLKQTEQDLVKEHRRTSPVDNSL